ncbi:MAG: sulfite exporter TauE/SafE family protein [Synergistaceae bacterium]|nr:sulfite exporter TauE/SafE family protein [Synergistaceae bacterium]
MNRKIRTETLRIDGMTCAGCENRILKKLKSVKGVVSADVSYAKGTARVGFSGETELKTIISAIESLDYKIAGPGEQKNPASERNDFIGALMLIAALYLFLNGMGGGILGGIFNFFPQAEAGMGYWMLFTVGLLTSVHCIAMCGGINLSQALSGKNSGAAADKSLVSRANFRPTVLYNAGRVISYTIVGGMVGALGSAVSFSGAMKGAVQLAAGIFMVILGLNMLGMFGFLRALTPRLPKFLTSRMEREKTGKGPLFVGLLNGLMPCGPLQAMQIYALSTGSPVKGALSMLAFSLGTVPLMFGLGAFGSLMSKRFAGRVMKAGAILVIIMGVVMFNNGTALSGLDLAGFDFSGGSVPNAPAPSPRADSPGEATVNANGIQEITTPLKRRGYPSVTVKAGTPVRWNLSAEKGTINGCNNAIVIPAFNIEKRLNVGDNIIEFTPTKAGKYRYSCWMGMIRGTITVTDADAADAPAAPPGAAEAAEPEPNAGDDFAAPSCVCCGGF